MKLKIQTIIFILLLIPLLSISQAQQKPKIGLVLSGGGAKGIAHLGMLYALDSLGIKPDYITGTSMGSIMGALYAIGYSADEIDIIIRDADWGYVLSDDIPLSDIEIDRKHAYKKSLLTLNFSNNLVPKLPSGIVYGQHISEYFSKLTWRVADVKDFNEFEIPYKCVSADLISGKPYFFDHGDLATAMRSSMSIPTVFSPVHIDSLLLVDGGVYRNFPVIDAKEMGAEILIGSYTGFDKTVTFEDMRSLTNVLIRSSIFAGIQDIQKQEDMCDFYIKYDLQGLGTKDFKKSGKIIDLGVKSMNSSSVLDSLVHLSNLLNKYPKTEREIIPERDSIKIASFKTNGLSMVSKEYMISKSGLEVGSKISKDDMTMALNSMMGALLFDKITYTLEKDTTSNDRDSFYINFDIVEKTRGQLQLSLNFDSFFGPAISTSLMARNVLLPGSKIQFGINISENPVINIDYDFFLGKNKKFQTSLNARYELLNVKSFYHLSKDLYFNIGSQTTSFADFSFDFGYNFNTNNKIGINASYQLGLLKLREGSELAYNISEVGEKGALFKFYYIHDNFNKQFYPTKGFKLLFSASTGTSFDRRLTVIDPNTNLESDTILNYSNFYQIRFRYTQLIEIGNKISLQPSIETGLSLSDVSMFNQFNIGGYSRQNRITNINMVGSNPYSYGTENYFMLNLNLQYKIIDNFYLTILSSATAMEEYDDETNTFTNKEHYGIGATAGYLSPLGPLDLGVSFNNSGDAYWHINIGFPF